MLDNFVLVIIFLFSIPVFSYSVYTVALLFGSIYYRPSPRKTITKEAIPRTSVLLAVYDEKDVVGETLSAIGLLDLPAAKLQVVVADDSDDDTVRVVDAGIARLRDKGIEAIVSRRGGRAGYKAGALNVAYSKVNGELVLLLDADSRVSTDSLTQGIETLMGGDVSFVSFRVGHYNRGTNLITRAFALFQDTIDGLQKMGSTRLGLPYSLQGGFVLSKTKALAKAGYWREGVLAEDADLSCRLFADGLKGKYISSAELLSEDPSSLRVWKRQAARVAQGWAQCLRLNLKGILASKDLGPIGRLGLLLTLLSPFAGLSWIVVSMTTAVAILAGALSPQASVFGNPLYLVAVSLPAVIFYVAGVNALRLRKMLSGRNLLLLPELSYTLPGMFTISAVSFVAGLAGRKGNFYRTPKMGNESSRTLDVQRGEGRGVLIAEGLVSVLSVGLSIPMILKGQFLLGLSLAGFGLVTLKSMELSRYLARGGPMGP